MIFEPLPLEGVILVRAEPVADARGHFARAFCTREFGLHGLLTQFPQHSVSHNLKRATLRGLHYQQEPYAETKLVRCVRGAVFDVVVDLRPGSPTYARWCGVELSAGTGAAIYIPPGLAHGFMTLEADTDLYYLISPEHQPGVGQSLRWNDPVLAIDWPMEPEVMSDADRMAPLLEAQP